ncbi:hypothetical protein OG21DRAFT_1476267 [Imleria badia]|nr:hypothetical protein OG21DRAFT_1476267 [Imleria badia]
MSALGSVFLGDFQRHRVFSSTPPSSPPESMVVATAEHLQDVLESLDGTDSPAKTSESASLPQGPAHIDPVLSLELRLRWLEALLLGVRQDTRDRKGRDKPPKLKPGESLVQLAGNVQHRLNTVVESNDGLKKFMHQYDQHAQWLTPAFALSGTLQGSAPTYDDMSPDELEALLSEMEPDIRAAERDMREIELLEQKGVLSAGKLADHEALQPRLHALLAAQEQDMRLAASLERRIASLVDRHATHVSSFFISATLAYTLSELFVAWDDVLTETESKVKRLERDKEERERLGYA